MEGYLSRLEGYFDRTSGTFAFNFQKVQKYTAEISEIDPALFEQPVNQKKVREIVLFIKETTQSQSNLTRNNSILEKLGPCCPRRPTKTKRVRRPIPIQVEPIITPISQEILCQNIKDGGSVKQNRKQRRQISRKNNNLRKKMKRKNNNLRK